MAVLEDRDGVAWDFDEGKFEGCKDMVSGKKRVWSKIF